VETKVGARVLPVSFTGRQKVMVTKQEKERDDKEKKKRSKTTSRSDEQKKSKKKSLGSARASTPRPS
jgi:hypothetical protein